MTDLTIGDETFRVEVAGDPTHPALVLSHALGADLSLWDAQVPALSKHFRVVRYDTRGHGGSTRGAAPTSIARLGADVLAILDALEIETAHFIGLSMGGAIGLWLLTHAPERIGRAVLASTGPRLGTPEAWNARITAALAEGMDSLAEATIARWFSPAFASREPARVEPVHTLLRNASPAGYAACCAALRDMDLRAAVGDIPHEVLVVTGRDDPGVAPDDVAALVASLAGARHVELDARHIVNIEAEAAFIGAVVGFLTAKPSRRAPAKRAAKAKPTASPARTQVKRGGAGRRSNPARSPLKKTPARRAPAKKAAAKKPAPGRRRPAATTVAVRRSPTTKPVPKTRTTAAKTTTAKTTTIKAASPRTAAAKTANTKTAARTSKVAPAKTTPARKAPAKTAARKTAAPGKAKTARRPTPAAAARGAVKKTKPRKAVKKIAKPVAKGVAKKLPAARRTAATKPRRPTGRGKR